jgi:hypothetical protein
MIACTSPVEAILLSQRADDDAVVDPSVPWLGRLGNVLLSPNRLYVLLKRLVRMYIALKERESLVPSRSGRWRRCCGSCRIRTGC